MIPLFAPLLGGLLSGLLSGLLGSAHAATLRVDPTNDTAYPTITAAVAAATTGDHIEVAGGTYQECLQISGLELSFAGEGLATLNGAGMCDAAVAVDSGAVVTFEGFTLMNPNARAASVSEATLNLIDSTVTGSGRSDWWGGAIYASSATLELERCSIEGNVGDYGGAVFLAASVTFADLDSTWTNNVASHAGGAIFAQTADAVRLEGSIFTDNAAPADAGGALAVEWYSTLSVQGATFTGNQAGGSGGAIFLYATYNAPYVADSTFVDNRAGGGGGAIETEWGNDLTVSNSTFDGNVAATSYGGAVAIWYDSDGVVTGSTFTGNQAAGSSGGALFLYPQESSLYDLTVSDTTFEANSAAYDGGAIWTGWVHRVAVTDSVFTTNTAGATGGGLLVYVADDAALTGTDFCGNTAFWAGGASVQWTTTDSWANDRFAQNSATYGGGITRYASYSGSMRNLTFAGNSATEWGGAYQASYAYADFRNNLVTWSPDGNGIYASETTTYTYTPVTYDGWYANTRIDAGGYFWVEDGVDGNQFEDPQFVSYAQDAACDTLDLRLSGTSPVRDAGDPAIVDPDGSRSDMGAWGGPGAPIEDHDGDGFDTTSDCDDANPETRPGIPEVCNGLDDDCDHVIDGADAAGATTFYADNDGDGYGDPAAPSNDCAAPPGTVADSTDCDDEAPGTYPGAPEILNDGVDQDCDGSDSGSGGSGDGDSGSGDSGDGDNGGSGSGGSGDETGGAEAKSGCGCASGGSGAGGDSGGGSGPGSGLGALGLVLLGIRRRPARSERRSSERDSDSSLMPPRRLAGP